MLGFPSCPTWSWVPTYTDFLRIVAGGLLLAMLSRLQNLRAIDFFCCVDLIHHLTNVFCLCASWPPRRFWDSGGLRCLYYLFSLVSSDLGFGVGLWAPSRFAVSVTLGITAALVIF
ncbi:hypothetical protein DFH08DRAFT_907090 [Mycena albidolilacea]|uniref:Uncharacterized protein n=1 Tax=Mycena albidolilacea TaxID=1033008 RepID=A0AAD6YXJ6_9AGAR|nr:hypothetical protein DFH08DRAFT_907090 [Mycena albidolilacea]